MIIAPPPPSPPGALLAPVFDTMSCPPPLPPFLLDLSWPTDDAGVNDRQHEALQYLVRTLLPVF